jgi:hypothetical protein
MSLTVFSLISLPNSNVLYKDAKSLLTNQLTYLYLILTNSPNILILTEVTT